MGYQALLFCPDEKMARTVTQVLSELDFTVVPCTEPFAAVKKLMGEHFDAVVVDCDNEQNATLLFKSARNTAHNQSALAVAVVEGQAGVAKAFRIGANLVLTKPINVEQAKGTLRVARGLLRKSEGAKPAAAGVSSTIKPAAAALPKLVPQRPVPSAPAAPAALPMATASAATKKPTSQPSVVASAPIVASIPIESESEVDIFDLSEETASDSIAKPAAHSSAPKNSSGVSATAEPRIQTAGNKTTIPGFGTNAASAPAPAREPKPGVSAGDKTSTTVAEPQSAVERAAGESFQAHVEEPSGPAFTFGGNVDETQSSSGGSKKGLLIVAAVLVIAACGYAAWTQWGQSSETSIRPTLLRRPRRALRPRSQARFQTPHPRSARTGPQKPLPIHRPPRVWRVRRFIRARARKWSRPSLRLRLLRTLLLRARLPRRKRMHSPS